MQYSLNLVKKLEEQFGLPLYVFDETVFMENYHKYVGCFQKVYPNYRVSYSYKTNYTPYICTLIKENGGYAEVVSEMEYNIARRIGYDNSKIIFNGPDKGQAGVDAALNGSIVNVDNIHELKRICFVAKEKPERNIKIGIRVNLDIGQSFISRFGMDKYDVKCAFKMVTGINNLNIVGLHCHISRCRDIEAWKKRTEIMLALSDEYFSVAPEYIDLGSGMFGLMEPSFAAQFNEIPSYEEYATATAELVAKHFSDLDKEKKPILFTEPGTTLINKYIDVIGKVSAIKNINGKSFAVMNCSEHNLGETCTLKQLPIEVIHTGNSLTNYDNLDFTGYTCLEQDVLYRNYCGLLSVGDYIVFGNTGGYSNVYKPPFIKPNCAMITVSSNEEFKLIKQAETFEDIMHTYMF